MRTLVSVFVLYFFISDFGVDLERNLALLVSLRSLLADETAKEELTPSRERFGALLQNALAQQRGNKHISKDGL